MKKIMNSSFTISKIDDINLRKYKINLKEYKIDVKKIIDILFSIKDLNLDKVFSSKISKIRFDISFCNDETIQKINKEYRKKDKATDVITFSLFMDDKNSIIYRKTADLGQIIISIETALKQSLENKNSLKQEILTLTCHGILHLFGFDHLNKKDYDFVVGIQNKVLKNFKEE